MELPLHTITSAKAEKQERNHKDLKQTPDWNFPVYHCDN